MEVCIPCNTSVCRDINSNSGSSTDPNNPTHYSSGDLSMNDLKTCLTEFLNIEGNKNLSPVKNDIGNVVREDENKDSDKRKSSNSTSEKCFSKCATFPPLGEPKSSADGLFGGEKKQEDDKTAEGAEVNGCAKSAGFCDSRSKSLPTPLKLVSAMKGSREKRGTAPKELSVTWAPDVYDPIPTSVSHVPSNKNQRHRNDGKKYGKKKQKGGSKSSRGSKGKDKKQARKNSGFTNKVKHEDSGVVGLSEPQVSNVDFNVESGGPFCGSSFLKESVTKLHFPVAEAT